MAGTGYVRPPDVAVVVTEAAGRPFTYLAQLPNGPIVVLEDTAAVIWEQAVACKGPDVASGVAAATGADAGEIREDVDRFLADLVRWGLLCTRSRLPS